MSSSSATPDVIQAARAAMREGNLEEINRLWVHHSFDKVLELQLWWKLVQMDDVPPLSREDILYRFVAEIPQGTPEQWLQQPMDAFTTFCFAYRLQAVEIDPRLPSMYWYLAEWLYALNQGLDPIHQYVERCSSQSLLTMYAAPKLMPQCWP